MRQNPQTTDPPVAPSTSAVDSPAISPAVDLMAEDLVPVSRAASELDVDGGTVTRWILNGVKGGRVNGQRPRVKLEAVRIGGRVYTTRQALARFVARLNGQMPTESEPTTSRARTAAQRRRDSEAASRLAEAMGA